MNGFTNFIREQGIFGLAVGFILGSSVSSLVSALVEDLLNPLISILFGSVVNMENLFVTVRGVDIRYGHFISVLTDFFVIAFVVYILFTYFGVALGKIEMKAGAPSSSPRLGGLRIKSQPKKSK